MKKTVVILLGILFLSFNGISQTVVPQNKPQREFIIRADLSTFLAMYNFFDRVKSTLRDHSDFPSNKVSAINDTLEICRNIILVQIESQYAQYLKEDSIANANIKKDTTGKKKK